MDLCRICWLPDATCLEGRCRWCDGSPPRTVAQITRWARTAGQVLNRYDGQTQDAMAALEYGLHNSGPGRRMIVPPRRDRW